MLKTQTKNNAQHFTWEQTYLFLCCGLSELLLGHQVARSILELVEGCVGVLVDLELHVLEILFMSLVHVLHVVASLFKQLLVFRDGFFLLLNSCLI